MPSNGNGSNSAAVGAVSYTSILEEHDVARTQREVRVRLLKDLALPEYNAGKESVGVVAHVAHAPLDSADIPVLGNLLLGIGDVDTLLLLLHSPGGDGTVVEKFVSLCRAQCKRFRVIIPNEAKSAATLIALGADEIVMGPTSEIGPIDAQVPVLSSGLISYLSAQSFIDTRDELVKKHAEQVKKGEDTSATMQMLASLDLPFITECERLMAFGRDVAKKFLLAHMFKGIADKKTAADKVVKTLSSVERFKVHGRLIDGRTARTELRLKVKLCGKSDQFWRKVWEYYTRAEVAIGRSAASKWLETEDELLMAARPSG